MASLVTACDRVDVVIVSGEIVLEMSVIRRKRLMPRVTSLD